MMLTSTTSQNVNLKKSKDSVTKYILTFSVDNSTSLILTNYIKLFSQKLVKSSFSSTKNSKTNS